MSTNLLGELAANNGTFFLSGNQVMFEGKIDQIIVRGNGINYVELYAFIDGNEVEVQGEYLGSFTTLPDGLRITPKNDLTFSKVYIENGETNAGFELVLAS